MIVPIDMESPWARDEAMKIARAMIEEGSFRGITLSEERIERTLASVNVFKAFDLKEHVVSGAIVGTLMPHWFSDNLMGMELIHYVYPTFRGTDAAARLLKAFEQWAFERGAAGIYVEQMSGINPDLAQRFYRGMGYERVGVMMQKGLSRVQSA